MKFAVAVISTLSLVAGSMAHMRMEEPMQWKSGPDVLAPLQPDGSDFPCQNAQFEITDVHTPRATYTAGGEGTLRVVGGATHGGGSGQMVITYDVPPTKESVWRVLHSWEGDHPVKADGNLSGDPDQAHPEIKFPIPAGLPAAANATVAWNWFNRIGNREHYMKCSTVKIVSDPSSRDSGSYDSLATAFRANSNGCIVPEGTNAINFGDSNANYVTIAPGSEPVPISCGGGGGGSPSTGGGEDNSGSEETPATPTSVATGPTGAPEQEETPATPTSVATGPTGAPEQEEDNSESGAGDEEELPVTQPTAPAATPTSAPSPNPDNSENDDSASTGGACKEGTTICSEGNTWSQCGSGVMQNMGLVPAGLQCRDGRLIVKRSVRFSTEHRRHRRSSRHV